MKIDNRYKIQKAVSMDETRYSIQNPLLVRDKKGKGRLVATNGRIMAIVPVELDKRDRAGNVPLAPIVETQGKEPTELIINGKARLTKGDVVTEYPRPEGQFPSWEQVQPKGKPVFEIHIDPALLLELARALGTRHGEGVTLKFRPGDNTPVEVEGYGEAHGLLMPMRKP